MLAFISMYNDCDYLEHKVKLHTLLVMSCPAKINYTAEVNKI